MKKLLIIPIIALLFSTTNLYLKSSVVFAQDDPTATPTKKPRPIATLTPTPTEEALPTISDNQVKDSLQERLKKAVEEKKDEAAQILNTSGKFATTGKLEEISNSSIKIANNTKDNRVYAIDENTVFVRLGKTVKLKDIQVGDWVIAMGYLDKNTLKIKRLVASDKAIVPKERKVIRSVVQKVNSATKSFTLVDDTPAELGGPLTHTVKIGTSKLDISTLEEGKTTIVIIGVPDATEKTTLTLKAYKIL